MLTLLYIETSVASENYSSLFYVYHKHLKLSSFRRVIGFHCSYYVTLVQRYM